MGGYFYVKYMSQIYCCYCYIVQPVWEIINCSGSSSCNITTCLHTYLLIINDLRVGDCSHLSAPTVRLIAAHLPLFPVSPKLIFLRNRYTIKGSALTSPYLRKVTHMNHGPWREPDASLTVLFCDLLAALELHPFVFIF